MNNKPSILISPKYAPISQEKSRYFIVTGGRGSSKSFSIASLLTLLTCEAGHKILFTRYTMTSAEISIIPEFLEKIDLMGLKEYFHITKNEIVNQTTGSVRYCLEVLKRHQETNRLTLNRYKG